MHKPAQLRPVTPVHRAFDDLKVAEEEAIRQIRTGHKFQTGMITLQPGRTLP